MKQNPNVVFYVERDGYELKTWAHVREPDKASDLEMIDTCVTMFSNTDQEVNHEDHIEWELI